MCPGSPVLSSFIVYISIAKLAIMYFPSFFSNSACPAAMYDCLFIHLYPVPLVLCAICGGGTGLYTFVYGNNTQLRGYRGLPGEGVGGGAGGSKSTRELDFILLSRGWV